MTSMTIDEVTGLLDGVVVLRAESGVTEVSSVCSSDLMSDLLHFSGRPKAMLITGLINIQVVRTAEIADIHVVVFVLDKRPGQDVIEMATDKGITLVSTKLSRFTACGRLYAAGLRSCTGEER